MKIKQIGFDGLDLSSIKGSIQGGIEFDNGWVMCDEHWQDCCENVYADWDHIRDEAGVFSYDFDEDSFRIESVENSGIRFGDGMVMFFVPCYNEQNGYYNGLLDIRVYRKRFNGSYVKLRRFDTAASTQDDIY